jgi:hypothetical protein
MPISHAKSGEMINGRVGTAFAAKHYQVTRGEDGTAALSSVGEVLVIRIGGRF